MRSHPFRRPSARSLGSLLPLFVAAACSSATTASTTNSSVVSSSTPEGTTTVTRTFEGAGQHPSVTVEAPSHWHGFKNFGVVDGCCGVAFWDVGEVAQNPCHSIGHLSDPGPSVDDLVTALEAQPLRHATAPTEVTLAGYHGKYLEWSVPKHWVVTGDGDFAGCDVQPNGHRDFVSWLGAGGVGERWQQVAGQVDRLWVLNINGQRLVIDASQFPNATQGQLDEQDQIVQSVRFLTST